MSSGSRAANLADPDSRTYWSSGTNAKEWVILELYNASYSISSAGTDCTQRKPVPAEHDSYQQQSGHRMGDIGGHLYQG